MTARAKFLFRHRADAAKRPYNNHIFCSDGCKKGVQMKLTKRIIAAAAVFAATMTLFVGCKGLLGNADDVESKGKREQSATEKKGAIDSQRIRAFISSSGRVKTCMPRTAI